VGLEGHIPLPGTPPEFASHFKVVEVCLRLSYIVIICQLTTAHAFFMIAAVMEPPDACRHSHDLAYPAVATLPASGASRPRSAGGTLRLDELRRPTRRRRHAEQATTAEASTAGTVRISGVYATSGGTSADVMDNMGRREKGARPVREHRPGWCR
jgi:hypothetical protein